MTNDNEPLWDAAFIFTVPVAMKSKSNYRHGKTSWTDLSNFETVVKMFARQHLPENWPLGNPKDPINARPKVLLTVIAKSNTDSTNYTKSVADALEGVVTLNDASITTATTMAERGTGDGVTIGVAVLPADSTLEQQLAASSELNAQTLTHYRANS